MWALSLSSALCSVRPYPLTPPAVIGWPSPAQFDSSNLCGGVKDEDDVTPPAAYSLITWDQRPGPPSHPSSPPSAFQSDPWSLPVNTTSDPSFVSVCVVARISADVRLYFKMWPHPAKTQGKKRKWKPLHHAGICLWICVSHGSFYPEITRADFVRYNLSFKLHRFIIIIF